jgi:hypothetical protein
MAIAVPVVAGFRFSRFGNCGVHRLSRHAAQLPSLGGAIARKLREGDTDES